jgi:hypothetical protein
MTKDEGKSFTLITPSSQTATTNAQGAHVSGDGGLVSFTAKGMTPPEFHAVNQLVSEKDEAWLYHASSNTLAKISNLAGKECSTKSLGSCYSMTTHQVTCNIAASACTSPNVHYAPGFVSSRNGCCHCVAGCNHTKETGANCAASNYQLLSDPQWTIENPGTDSKRTSIDQTGTKVVFDTNAPGQ